MEISKIVLIIVFLNHLVDVNIPLIIFEHKATCCTLVLQSLHVVCVCVCIRPLVTTVYTTILMIIVHCFHVIPEDWKFVLLATCLPLSWKT